MDRQNKTCPDVLKHLSSVNLEHTSTVNMLSHFKTLLFSGNYYSEHMRYQQMHLTWNISMYSCKRICKVHNSPFNDDIANKIYGNQLLSKSG